MWPKLIVLLIGIAYQATAVAETIVVTSNADAGPGTLREAIIRCNNNPAGTIDYIHFNLPDLSLSGRTIFLVSVLPDLTSDIVIDGSVQPGSKIGVSDAKIRISNPDGIGVDYVFRLMRSKNVAIYGIHFHKINVDPNGWLNGVHSAIAILLRHVENIKIGAAGKGNYFTNLHMGISWASVPNEPGLGSVNGLEFKSNIVNLSNDGTAIEPGSNVIAMILNNAKNLQIGGEAPGEENYLSGPGELMVLSHNDSFGNVNFGYTKILNNKLGCSYDETIALNCGTVQLQAPVQGFTGTDTSQILVRGNSYNSRELQTFLKIIGKKGFFEIKDNRIGLLGDFSSSWFQYFSSAIKIEDCDSGIIGGDNPGDANYIAGSTYNAIGVENSKKIRITKNSIYCNGKGIYVWSPSVEIPKTNIVTITDYDVKGTCLPNSTIEVFLTKTCTGCENGKTFLGSTLTDALGNWSFTSPVLLDGAVTATGTSVQGNTGEFAKPEYHFENYSVINPTCGLANGSIKGVRVVSGTRYYWVRQYNGTSDTLYTEDVTNAGPGIYRFVVEQGKYCSAEHSFYMADNSPNISEGLAKVVNPSCGLNNGSISSIFVNGIYHRLIWKDSVGNEIANHAEVNNLGPGRYKLIALDTIYGCVDSTDYFTLVNQSGASLNWNNTQITASSCSGNNGSITGISALNGTGNPFVQWVDSADNPVGNDYNLVNVYPGRYRLKFKDAGACDTIMSPYYVIPDQGVIVIDTSSINISPTKCLTNTASIQNIQVTGGDTYRWINVPDNATVGNTLDAFGLPAGKYQLVVSNAIGCTRSSPVFDMPAPSFLNINVTQFDVLNASCEQSNGFIKINSFDTDSQFYSFKWIDSSTATIVGTETTIINLHPTTYQLQARDSNGCEKIILSSQIKSIPLPEFNYTQVKIDADRCNLNTGKISDVQLSGLIGPASYAWYNENNVQVSNNINLQNAAAGVYTLRVTDQGNCILQSKPFTVSNVNDALIAPVYDPLTIARNSTAALQLKNSGQGMYHLSNRTSGSPSIQQNQTGNFTIANINADTAFYVMRVNGSCSSAVTRVSIKVFNKSYFAIPTAFTPNNDRINDRLPVKVMGQIDLHYFRIFNRWGQLIFETNTANSSWDGTIKGVFQPTDNYVWMAEGKDPTGVVIQQKGSFLLIR